MRLCPDMQPLWRLHQPRTVMVHEHVHMSLYKVECKVVDRLEKVIMQELLPIRLLSLVVPITVLCQLHGRREWGSRSPSNVYLAENLSTKISTSYFFNSSDFMLSYPHDQHPSPQGP